jgi:hypothetical protein
MTKDIKKKSLHELVQEFPEKTYRELEIYRDADRHEESQQIPLTESQKKQEELEPIVKGVCITASMKQDRGEGLKLTELLAIENDKLRNDRTYPDLTEVMAIENDKLKKKGIELSVELSEIKVVLKGTKGVVEEYHRGNVTLTRHLNEAKRTIKNLETRFAEVLEIDEAHQKQMGKVQERLTEVEEDNKKLSGQINNYLKKHEDNIRKSGL